MNESLQEQARKLRGTLATTRSDGRKADQPRPFSIIPEFTRHAEGSVLVTTGDTKVICTASLEDRVPPFLRGSGKGWITAEYGMLPRSTNTRTPREVTAGKPSGRTAEIQRLIGRSLRSVVELELLGERTVWIDCDVIQADGGTRTAAISGGFVALVLALRRLAESHRFPRPPVRRYVSAVSVGLLEDVALLDLNYAEDAGAAVDLNVVMTDALELIEIQGTAEEHPFARARLDEMLNLAELGIRHILKSQQTVLGPTLL
jgi:ribonuclease PH